MILEIYNYLFAIALIASLAYGYKAGLFNAFLLTAMSFFSSLLSALVAPFFSWYIASKMGFTANYILSTQLIIYAISYQLLYTFAINPTLVLHFKSFHGNVMYHALGSVLTLITFLITTGYIVFSVQISRPYITEVKLSWPKNCTSIFVNCFNKVTPTKMTKDIKEAMTPIDNTSAFGEFNQYAINFTESISAPLGLNLKEKKFVTDFISNIDFYFIEYIEMYTQKLNTNGLLTKPEKKRFFEMLINTAYSEELVLSRESYATMVNILSAAIKSKDIAEIIKES